MKKGTSSIFLKNRTGSFFLAVAVLLMCSTPAWAAPRWVERYVDRPNAADTMDAYGVMRVYSPGRTANVLHVQFQPGIDRSQRNCILQELAGEFHGCSFKRSGLFFPVVVREVDAHGIILNQVTRRVTATSLDGTICD